MPRKLCAWIVGSVLQLHEWFVQPFVIHLERIALLSSYDHLQRILSRPVLSPRLVVGVVTVMRCTFNILWRSPQTIQTEVEHGRLQGECSTHGLYQPHHSSVHSISSPPEHIVSFHWVADVSTSQHLSEKYWIHASINMSRRPKWSIDHTVIQVLRPLIAITSSLLSPCYLLTSREDCLIQLCRGCLHV